MENELRKMFSEGKKSKDIESYCRGVMRLYTKERLEYLYSNDIKIFGDNKSLEDNIYEQSICGLIKCIDHEILHGKNDKL